MTAGCLLFNDVKAPHLVTILLSLLYLLSFTFMVYLVIKVTASDPTDLTTSLERRSRLCTNITDRKLIFDQEKYSFFCDLCNTHVLENSKHCFKCNRCTFEFDHHCAWLSNDIGLYNYVNFLRMLLTVLLTCFFQLAMCCYALTVFWDDSSDEFIFL